MRFSPLKSLLAALCILAISSCSRNDNDQIAKLKSEVAAAKAEAAAARAEVAKKQLNGSPVDSKDGLEGKKPPLTVAGGTAITITFSKDSVGKLPTGWKSVKGDWMVIDDATAPSKSGFVLAQVGASLRTVFNLCVTDAVKAMDVEISVQFNAGAGKDDQGGGIVWRYQNADNYYVARFNPLEDNYRVYKVVGGQRIQMGTAEDITIKANTWHRMSIRHVGKKITCLLDGKKLLEADDDTITGTGLVGLWTKADAQTQFDEFAVRVFGGKK